MKRTGQQDTQTASKFGIVKRGAGQARQTALTRPSGVVLAGAFALVGASLLSQAFAQTGGAGRKISAPTAKPAPAAVTAAPVNATPAPANAATVSPAQAEYFETHVRPLLFSRCYSCHNDKAQMGGLRLDSLNAMLKGGGGGPALVPGNVDKSHLLAAIRYDGALKMPPNGKLKDQEIAALTEWVKMGAPWPGARVSDAARMAQKGEYVVSDAQKNHWAFQPVKNPALPAVKNLAWCKTPIDRFILAGLEAKGLKPAPQADRRTLLRRATFDLTGLPPTSEEIDAFVGDKSPDAWSKVIDRLLASPRYGERWARHWLDVARYADTKGYVFVDDPLFHNAYTYRDWVVSAFNRDLGYDQFLTQQLAADLACPGDRSAQAAMGYITLGRRFLNDGQLINDDRIDVTSRGMMGLTVACARCHDHKFDPIPTKDYYALYSVFDRTGENTVPISPDNISQPYEQYEKKVRAAQSERDELIQSQIRMLRAQIAKTPDSLPAMPKATLAAFRENTLPDAKQLAVLTPLFEDKARTRLTELQATLADLTKNKPATPEFGIALAENGRSDEQRVFVRGNAGNRGDVAPRRFLTILSATQPKPLPDKGSGRLELARYITSRDNPLTPRVFVNRVWLYHFGQGLVRTPSDFGLRGERPTHPQLLDWLAYHFEEGETRRQGDKETGGQGDEGTASAANGEAVSSSPRLLVSSSDCNWSVKKLQRLILLSAAYQQSSDAPPAEANRAFASDPENRLLWRQNRQRLDLEGLRDSLLFASGKLDGKIGGPAVELMTAPYTTRRTLYGLVNRNNLQGLYRTFDFATPDSSSAQRINTSVPQQALFLMNSPFVVEQATTLAQNPDVANAPDESGRIKALYRRLFGRAPQTDEIALGLAFLHQPVPPTPATAASAWQYGWGSLDADAGRVKSFAPFGYFSKQGQWQASKTFPDPKLQYLSLNGRGGHPGWDMDHAVIRRWTAPADGTVGVEGELEHPAAQGDGVRAHVISSRSGEAAQWTVLHGKTATNVAQIMVKRGDTLDFVIDCGKANNQDSDSFAWTPRVHVVAPSGTRLASNAPKPETLEANRTWDAAADFSGPPPPPIPPLTQWERYVQTLLMTNEFNFVD